MSRKSKSNIIQKMCFLGFQDNSHTKNIMTNQIFRMNSRSRIGLKMVSCISSEIMLHYMGPAWNEKEDLFDGQLESSPISGFFIQMLNYSTFVSCVS